MPATRAPGFREVAVLDERRLSQGKRTWRISICRHLADGDLVVLFSNRDRVYGGSRIALYRGDDLGEARAAAQSRFDKALSRGYVMDGRPTPFCDPGPVRPALSLAAALRQSR